MQTYQGPVVQSIVSSTKSLVNDVQSIVSSTKSLVNDSLSLLVRIKSSVLIFFAEKNCEGLLHCKSSSHFFGKKRQCFYV